MPHKLDPSKATITTLDFSSLVDAIRQVHDHSAGMAKRAVNTSLTLRNWVIGAYIAEYELNGADRANYGDALLKNLAKHLTTLRISNCSRRQLYRYLRLFRLYPEIVGTVSPQFPFLVEESHFAPLAKPQEIVGTPSPLLGIATEKLIECLSYSHLELILDLEYALSSMSDRLFVSKYQLELPSKESLQEFIETKQKEMTA